MGTNGEKRSWMTRRQWQRLQTLASALWMAFVACQVVFFVFADDGNGWQTARFVVLCLFVPLLALSLMLAVAGFRLPPEENSRSADYAQLGRRARWLRHVLVHLGLAER